jgi:spore coat protein U-like protein
MKRILIATTALLGVMVAQDAWAVGEATSNMNAYASVDATCVVSTTRLAFYAGQVAPNADSSGAQIDATAFVKVHCTDGAAYDVGLGNGANFLGTRRLASGENFIAYNLYSDSAHDVSWGNTLHTDTVEGFGNGSVQTLTVYGRITAGQSLSVGQYTDIIPVTVYY